MRVLLVPSSQAFRYLSQQLTTVTTKHYVVQLGTVDKPVVAGSNPMMQFVGLEDMHVKKKSHVSCGHGGAPPPPPQPHTHTYIYINQSFPFVSMITVLNYAY